MTDPADRGSEQWSPAIDLGRDQPRMQAGALLCYAKTAPVWVSLEDAGMTTDLTPVQRSLHGGRSGGTLAAKSVRGSSDH